MLKVSLLPPLPTTTDDAAATVTTTTTTPTIQSTTISYSSLLHSVQTGSEAHPVSNPMGTGKESSRGMNPTTHCTHSI
jgi:hypothetical protein